MSYSLRNYGLLVTANTGKISFNDKVVTDGSGFWCLLPVPLHNYSTGNRKMP